MSKPTQTLLGIKALRAIYEGVNAIFAPVSRTFGPEGKNALLFRTWGRGSRITNDGVTVSECQIPKNPFVRLVAETFKEGSRKTGEKVGDGTTLTTILGGHLFNQIYSKLLESLPDMNAAKSSGGVIRLKKEILESAERIKEEIKKVAVKIETLEDLEKIAIISVEDKVLGKIIAKMAWEVGIDGFIDTVEGYKGEIETEVIKGMRFPAKVGAKAFVNNPARYEMVAEEAPVFITNYAFDNAADFVRIFKPFGAKTSKVIIIAPSFSDNVLMSMVATSKAGYFIYPVAVPSLRTEQFEDVAIYCGANFIDKAKGKKLYNAQFGDLGYLEKLVVKDTEAKEDAVALGGLGTTKEKAIEEEVGFKEEEKPLKLSPIQERIETLKKQLDETKQESFKNLLRRRIASMSSAVGVIRVGGSTEAASLYKKLKIEDAVYACKAALRSGYVKGGGLCLKEIGDKLPESDILKETLIAPYQQIQDSFDGGLDISEDVIDPMEVVLYGIEHATQIVANLATVEMITCEAEEKDEGNLAIAKAITEFVISDKIKKGQLRESEADAYRESMGGLTEDEYLQSDKG